MATSTGAPDLSFLDTLSALSAEDEPVVDKPATDNKTPTEVDLFKLDADEDETEEETEETTEEESEEEDSEENPEVDLNDDLDLDIPNRQKILKEFPELFKKFPTIEKAIYREQAYSEVFPNPKDAEQAKKDLGILARIEEDLSSGNISNLLSGLKRGNEKAFEHITDNILETVQKLNPTAYLKNANGIIKNILVEAKAFGTNADKESFEGQVAIAAQLIHKWIYKTHEIEPAVVDKKPETKDPREEEITRREKEFETSALNRAVSEVDERMMTSLNKSVSDAIDPKAQMTAYVKDKAVEDTIKEFRKELSKDKRFGSLIDRLWIEAKSNNYNDASKTKIREAIKRQAKQLLPDIIRRVKAEALKGTTVRNRNTAPRSEKPIQRGRPASANTNSGVPKGNSGVPKGMSSVDFLMQD